MDTRSPDAGHETRTLARDACGALVSALVPALRQSVLLQLLAWGSGAGRSGSVFVVYREGGMTFEAIAEVILDDDDEPEQVLMDLLQQASFAERVLDPLAEQVRRHFRR